MLQAIRSIAVAILPVLVCAVPFLGCGEDLPPLEVQTQTVLSRTYVVDQIYRSMKGPQETIPFKIGDGGPPEELWILSYETDIVDPATGELASEEFMCHNNLDFASARNHQEVLGTAPMARKTPRMFTLSQGGMGVVLPKGFGIRMMSSENLTVMTQILNLNPIDRTREIQYKTTVRYVREQDAGGRIRPLFQRGLQGLKLIDGVDGYYGVDHGDDEIHGESCSIGELAGQRTIRDRQGRSFAAHWVVKPGREENHSLVTEMLALQQDTTIHHIAVHLHPFAESLELRDLTTDETVFKSMATNSADRIGLEHVESYSSREGIRIYKDHEYTLISIYDNTSSEDQDAMAVMFVYMIDNNLERKFLAAN